MSYNNHTNIAAATTTIASPRAGVLIGITINTPADGATITVYDSLAASGSTIATITLPADASAMAPRTISYGARYETGLAIVTTGTGLNITAVWR